MIIGLDVVRSSDIFGCVTMYPYNCNYIMPDIWMSRSIMHQILHRNIRRGGRDTEVAECRPNV